MKHDDTYDKQIEAILDEDYDWLHKKNFIIDSSATSHYALWGSNGGTPSSIFAYMNHMWPDMYLHCASTIEHTKDDLNSPSIKKLKDAVLKDKKVSLPNLLLKDSPLKEEELQSYKFTREELEEFARRQRAAKEYYKSLKKIETGALV